MAFNDIANALATHICTESGYRLCSTISILGNSAFFNLQFREAKAISVFMRGDYVHVLYSHTPSNWDREFELADPNCFQLIVNHLKELSMTICVNCSDKIAPERLEALPGVKTCVKCAQANPEPPRHDPNVVCAKSSTSARNGFGVND